MTITCADAITLITGKMCVPVERLYELYNGLTGDNLFTHQLWRAAKVCDPHARAHLPAEFVKYADDAAFMIDADSWEGIVAHIAGRYGDAFEIPPLADWQSIDPLTEAVGMMEGGAK